MANALSNRVDVAVRLPSSPLHGAFFVVYSSSNESQLVSDFWDTTIEARLDVSRSAVLCRSRELVKRLRGTSGEYGRGVVQELASAALFRDSHGDFARAFQLVASAITRLIIGAPLDFSAQIRGVDRYDALRPVRRAIWAFVRDPRGGLPSTSLLGDSEWHPQLLAALRLLFVRLSDYGLKPVEKLGRIVTKADLPHTPLGLTKDTLHHGRRIRIDTVHQAKGESLDAVLYLANTQQASALIEGATTELGRIGYVAVTRARDLFWLGVPETGIKKLREPLKRLGLQPWLPPVNQTTLPPM
ncbi:MAG: 3'-5' exonuclease [Polyangiaceae bacterium]